MLHASRLPVQDTFVPPLEECHGDAGVVPLGLPDDAEAELDARADAEPAMTDAELDYLCAREDAIRKGVRLFRLTCGAEILHVAAVDSDAAYRKARRQDWPKGKGPICTEYIGTPGKRRLYVCEFLMNGRWLRFPDTMAASVADAIRGTKVLYGDKWPIRARLAEDAGATTAA